MKRTFDECVTLFEFASAKEWVCKSLLKIQFGGLTIKLFNYRKKLNIKYTLNELYLKIKVNYIK